MRKELNIFFLMFFIFSLVQGADNYRKLSDNEVEAELYVTATVVEDVKVEVQDVDFGEVAAGEERSNPKVDGKINIVGEAGRGVVLAITHDGREINIGSNTEQMELINSDSRESGTIEYYPEFYSGDSKSKLSNKSLILNNGSATMNVGGKLVVPETTKFGNYTTNMSIRVYYN